MELVGRGGGVGGVLKQESVCFFCFLNANFGSVSKGTTLLVAFVSAIYLAMFHFFGFLSFSYCESMPSLTSILKFIGGFREKQGKGMRSIYND